ncbi:MAG: hypothetical protein WCB53_00265, partial [Terriglobales bacterium]
QIGIKERKLWYETQSLPQIDPPTLKELRVKQDTALVRSTDGGQAPQKSGLPSAVRPQQSYNLAGFDFQRDVV